MNNLVFDNKKSNTGLKVQVHLYSLIKSCLSVCLSAAAAQMWVLTPPEFNVLCKEFMANECWDRMAEHVVKLNKILALEAASCL